MGMYNNAEKLKEQIKDIERNCVFLREMRTVSPYEFYIYRYYYYDPKKGIVNVILDGFYGQEIVDISVRHFLRLYGNDFSIRMLHQYLTKDGIHNLMFLR